MSDGAMRPPATGAASRGSDSDALDARDGCLTIVARERNREKTGQSQRRRKLNIYRVRFVFISCFIHVIFVFSLCLFRFCVFALCSFCDFFAVTHVPFPFVSPLSFFFISPRASFQSNAYTLPPPCPQRRRRRQLEAAQRPRPKWLRSVSFEEAKLSSFSLSREARVR